MKKIKIYQHFLRTYKIYSKYKNINLAVIINFILLLILSGCTSVPYTERSQLMLISEKRENKIGANEYQIFKNNSHLSDDSRYISAVKRVEERIKAAADKKEYKWLFIVVDSPEANAFCMPGGKIVVYSGIFNFIKNDGELATVLGHEVGHAIARHIGETLTIGYLESSFGIGVNITLAVLGIPGIFGAVYGTATQLGIDLPYSRTQEYEADYIGLMLMAKAGYDPKTAIAFWENFSKQCDYGPVKEFFSTHPMGEKRIVNIKTALPVAEKIYSSARDKLGVGENVKEKKLNE
jgi:metalloendopeptidase OMA1, mitochondrial